MPSAVVSPPGETKLAAPSLSAVPKALALAPLLLGLVQGEASFAAESLSAPLAAIYPPPPVPAGSVRVPFSSTNLPPDVQALFSYGLNFLHAVYTKAGDARANVITNLSLRPAAATGGLETKDAGALLSINTQSKELSVNLEMLPSEALFPLGFLVILGHEADHALRDPQAATNHIDHYQREVRAHENEIHAVPLLRAALAERAAGPELRAVWEADLARAEQRAQAQAASYKTRIELVQLALGLSKAAQEQAQRGAAGIASISSPNFPSVSQPAAPASPGIRISGTLARYQQPGLQPQPQVSATDLDRLAMLAFQLGTHNRLSEPQSLAQIRLLYFACGDLPVTAELSEHKIREGAGRVMKEAEHLKKFSEGEDLATTELGHRIQKLSSTQK